MGLFQPQIVCQGTKFYLRLFFGANTLESTQVKCQKIEVLAFNIEFLAFRIEVFVAFQIEFLASQIKFFFIEEASFCCFWQNLVWNELFLTDFVIHCNFLVPEEPNARKIVSKIELMLSEMEFLGENRVFGSKQFY